MNAEAQVTTVEPLIETVRRERVEAQARTVELARARHQLERVLAGEQLVGYACACKCWSLKLPLGGDDPAAEATATADILERHVEHVERGINTTLEFGYGVRCTPFAARDNQTGQVRFTGIMCGSRAPRKRCQVCKVNWSVAQCDYPTGGKCRRCKGLKIARGHNCEPCAGTGRQMCNQHLCIDCRAHRDPAEDYCPTHRTLAGFGPLLKKEVCAWSTTPQLVNRKCLRESCVMQIAFGQRVLYFPRRARAMCVACGQQYEQLFT